MKKNSCIIALSLLLAIGCGKKNDSSSAGNLTLSAILGSGLNGHSFTNLPRDLFEMARGAGPFFVASAATANSVIAVPLYNGQLNAYAMPYAVMGTVDATGKMTIALNKSQDYVVMLLDTTQANKIDQVVGYLNLADASKGLLRIPSKTTSGDSMDVGTVTQTSGSSAASSSKTISDLSTQFTIDITVLRELARTDDILQVAKNIYANFISATNYSEVQPYFAFNGTQSAAVNAFTTPDTIPYSGYGLYFNLVKPGLVMQDLCGASARAMVLTPPSAIVSATLPAGQGGGGGTSFNALSNSGVSDADTSGSSPFCGSPAVGGDSAASIYVHASSLTDTQIGFNWGGGNGFTGAIAAGNWVLTLAGATVGSFDLQAASVMDAGNHPSVYMPALKIDTDGSGLVTKVTVKIYTWDNATSAFVQVTDTTAFQSAAKYISIGMTDYGQSPRVEGYYTAVAQADGTFTLTNFEGKAWKQGTYGTGTPANPATTSVDFTYNLYGASIRFDYR